MALTRDKKIATVLIAVSVLGLGAVISVTMHQRAQLDAQQQMLDQTKSEIAKAQSSLDTATQAAQQQTQELKDAVKNSEQYQQEQRVQSLRARRIANGLTAANIVKIQMAECYMTVVHWPSSNAECGISPPTSFANTDGLRSITVVPNGKIKIELVDEVGKPAMLWLSAAVNSAMQVNWVCTTKDIADISTLVPACRFESR